VLLIPSAHGASNQVHSMPLFTSRGHPSALTAAWIASTSHPTCNRAFYPWNECQLVLICLTTTGWCASWRRARQTSRLSTDLVSVVSIPPYSIPRATVNFSTSLRTNTLPLHPLMQQAQPRNGLTLTTKNGSHSSRTN